MKAVWHSPIVGKLSPVWLLVTEIHVRDFGISTSWVLVSYIQNSPKHILLPTLYLVSLRFSKETRIFHLPWAYTVEMAKGENENKGGYWGLAREYMGMAQWLILLKIWGNLSVKCNLGKLIPQLLLFSPHFHTIFWEASSTKLTK